jgi:hypothetical protein
MTRRRSPPLILNYSASTVPILQLALSGKGLTEQQLYDLGQNQIRPALVTVPGLAMPFPSGGMICPLLSGPETMIVWTTKGTMNAEQEAQAGRDYRQAA